jgi:hypothetical protein
MDTMASKRLIYISSTFSDLEDHRTEVKASLEKGGYDVACMEKYPAFEERPLEKCLADVAATDGYVLLVAHRYGHRPREGNPDHKSITQLEYEQAICTNKRPLVFTIDDDHPWQRKWMDRGDDEAAVIAFRAAVEERHGVNWFTIPEQLASLVLAALASQEEPEGRHAQATAGRTRRWMPGCRRTGQRWRGTSWRFPECRTGACMWICRWSSMGQAASRRWFCGQPTWRLPWRGQAPT